MRDLPHPSDQDLVLSLDGELGEGRRAGVDAHLVACESCRQRRTRLGNATVGLNRVDQPDAAAIARSRAALKAKLTTLADERTGARSIWSGLAIPRWAAAAAAIVAIVVLGRILQQEAPFSPSTGTSESGALPIATLTPGATSNLSTAELCSPGDQPTREIADDVRREVVRRYGMERVAPDAYELDYLITPQLGGAPTVQNLWPQRYASRVWNAHVKDQLEDLLPELVCAGSVPLTVAQRDIAADWIAAYRKYFRTDVPLQTRARARPVGPDDESRRALMRRPAGAPALRLASYSAISR